MFILSLSLDGRLQLSTPEADPCGYSSIMVHDPEILSRLNQCLLEDKSMTHLFMQACAV